MIIRIHASTAWQQADRAAAQIVLLNGLPVVGVFEDGDEALAEASVIGREHVAQPMERLHEAHAARAARPIKAARARPPPSKSSVRLPAA